MGRLPSLASAIAIGAALACRTAAAPASGGGPPIVLVGIDAGDWRTIDPLVSAGKLPTFARLKSSGATGLMLSTPPLVSPIVWTTIATGRPPEEHGVLDFMVDLPSGGQAPIGSAQRRVPALWTLFSAAGRKVDVVGWWATGPAESVTGTIVSDQVAPQLTRPEPLAQGLVSPASSASALAHSIVRPQDVSFEELSTYVPLARAEYDHARDALRTSASRFYQDPLAHLAAVAAGTKTYGRMAEELLRRDRPDLLVVYLEGVDTISHLFVRDRRRGPAAIARAYQDADALIGGLAEASPPEALVIVCSDHGFYPAEAAIADDPADLTGPATAWHRPYGIVAAASAGALSGRAAAAAGPAVRDAGAISPLDVAPTVLHAAGLPVKSEMPGHVVSALLPSALAARSVRTGKTTETASAAPAATTADGDGARARLQALGYIGATTTTSLAQQNLGEILYRRGRLEAAERELRAVVEAQPQNVAAHLWLAKTLRDRGRTAEALRVYERAVALPGERGEALLEAVDLAVSTGTAGEAQRLLEAARRGGADSAAVQVARAMVAQAAGRRPEAESALRAALARDPLSFAALSRLLDLQIASGRAAEALPPLHEALRRAPASPQHQALLGEALLAVGHTDEAVPALTTALALAPDSAAVRLDLARAQLRQRKLDDARATLGPAPASADRSILLGAIASTQERWPEAAEQYRAALAAGPPTPELLNGLGWAELKLGRSSDAAELFGRSLGLRPDQPEIRRLLTSLPRPPASRP